MEEYTVPELTLAAFINMSAHSSDPERWAMVLDVARHLEAVRDDVREGLVDHVLDRVREEVNAGTRRSFLEEIPDEPN